MESLSPRRPAYDAAVSVAADDKCAPFWCLLDASALAAGAMCVPCTAFKPLICELSRDTVGCVMLDMAATSDNQEKWREAMQKSGKVEMHCRPRSQLI